MQEIIDHFHNDPNYKKKYLLINSLKFKNLNKVLITKISKLKKIQGKTEVFKGVNLKKSDKP